MMKVPPDNRKFSVSFVSEALPTMTNGPSMVQTDPSLKALQQKILRLQVTQVVLGLTLMVLSAVAIIEERVLFGLGFGIISALLSICSAGCGIQQCRLKTVAIMNMIALAGLIPSFCFTFRSLVQNFCGTDDVLSSEELIPFVDNDLDPKDLQQLQYYDEGTSVSPTLWIIGWLELIHLIPLCCSLLYLMFLYRYLSYYTHF